MRYCSRDASAAMQRFGLAGILVVLVAVLPGPSVANAEKPKLAVMDLLAKGGIEQQRLDVFCDILATEIRGLGEYDVITKSDIESMLGIERAKEFYGCEDTSCLAEIGGALGVQYIVSGNVALFVETYAVNLKLIDIRRARVENSVFHKIKGDEQTLLDEFPRAVHDLFGREVTAPPASEEGPADRPGLEPEQEPGSGPKSPTEEASEPEAAREPDTEMLQSLRALGFGDLHLKRLRESEVVPDGALLEVSRKLTGRGFTPGDVTEMATKHGMLKHDPDAAVVFALYFAAGMPPEEFEDYLERERTLTEHYNNWSEYVALDIIEWLILGGGLHLGILGAIFWCGAESDLRNAKYEMEREGEKDDVEFFRGMFIIGASGVGIALTLIIIDAVDVGDLPEGFFKSATKAQILEATGSKSLPRTTREADIGRRLSLIPWVDHQRTGLLLGIRF